MFDISISPNECKKLSRYRTPYPFFRHSGYLVIANDDLVPGTGPAYIVTGTVSLDLSLGG